MNKKVVGIILVCAIVLAVITGVVYLVNNDSLNENDSSLEGVETEPQLEESKEIALPDEIEENSTNNDKDESQKILIAYFSRADENYEVGTVDVGNTEIMAGFIKDYLGDRADTFKIDPVKAYPKSYKECTEVATQELKDDARPEFKNSDSINLDDYDTVFIGYPIWWGDVPMIINTFLEKYDFSGKTIIPFNTHEGSGNSGTYTMIKNKMKSSTVNTKGLAISGKTARQESSRKTVEDWLEGLGY